MLKSKTHIFFDLDHTLWDYDRCCGEALSEIYFNFDLKSKGIDSGKSLINQFHMVNNRLWDLYDSRQITSDELRYRRFREIFDEFAISNKEICDQLHEAYMEISPNKPYLIDGAMEVLAYLKPKYSLHVITNGIEDIQAKKMKASGVEKYFETVTCSQKANARKPEKTIFEYAAIGAKASMEQSVMIGDNYLVDIKGAVNAGMDYIYFNPENKKVNIDEKSVIKHLLELKQIL